MGRLKGSKNRVDKSVKFVRFQYSIYRLNVSYLSGFGTFQTLGKDRIRMVGRCSRLDQLKAMVLEQILRNQRHRGLRYHSVAWETHQSTGQPHLDVLLIYDKIVLRSLSSFNYLLPLCPQRESQTTPGVYITGYSRRRLNQAILEYGRKQDPRPLLNFPENVSRILNVRELEKDPYACLEDQMSKDPLHFNLEEYVHKEGIARHIKGWSGIKTKLKDMQVAAANLLLRQRPGFRLITRQLIQSRLTPQQLRTFDSWDGYQSIVDCLNQVVLHKCSRPFKSKQLLLVGPPDIGKTSLVRVLERYVSTYHMGVSNWFPNYRDEAYRLIFWDQFKLKGGMIHTDLLKFLQGSPMDLQYKGGSSLKTDNQLVVMTSNMTLNHHIRLKFKDRDLQLLARKNLKSRILEIIVPESKDLFLLQQLILPF